MCICVCVFAPQAAGDSLVALCEFGWDNHLRLSGAGQPAGACKYNPTLLDVSRVRCPEELVHAIRRGCA